MPTTLSLQTKHRPFHTAFINNDVIADNRNYVRVVNIVIELYTENKDFALEDNIESKLLYPYTKDVVYINSEKMYQITYESEVVLKNE